MTKKAIALYAFRVFCVVPSNEILIFPYTSIQGRFSLDLIIEE